MKVLEILFAVSLSAVSLVIISFRSWLYSSVRRASDITLPQMMISVLKTFAIFSRKNKWFS